MARIDPHPHELRDELNAFKLKYLPSLGNPAYDQTLCEELDAAYRSAFLEVVELERLFNALKSESNALKSESEDREDVKLDGPQLAIPMTEFSKNLTVIWARHRQQARLGAQTPAAALDLKQGIRTPRLSPDQGILRQR